MLTKFSFWGKVSFWMRGLLIAFGIAVASLALIYQPLKIEGNSMTPLLSNHEAIIINRLVYHFEPIRRGDVVVSVIHSTPPSRTSSALSACRARPSRSDKVWSMSMEVGFLSLMSYRKTRI